MLTEKMDSRTEDIIEDMKRVISEIAADYYISKASLFGSRADGTNREDSDIDLIIEFKKPVTLLMLSRLKIYMEGVKGLKVDVVHGPIRETDMIELGKVIELYAA